MLPPCQVCVQSASSAFIPDNNLRRKVWFWSTFYQWENGARRHVAHRWGQVWTHSQETCGRESQPTWTFFCQWERLLVLFQDLCDVLGRQNSEDGARGPRFLAQPWLSIRPRMLAWPSPNFAEPVFPSGEQGWGPPPPLLLAVSDVWCCAKALSGRPRAGSRCGTWWSGCAALLLSHVCLFVNPCSAAPPVLPVPISWSLPKFMSIEAVMPSNHLILCHPLLLLPLIFASIRVFSHESALHVRWPKYWSFSIRPSNEYSGLISYRIDWFDLLAVQGTLKSLFQHHSSKASILWCSPFFIT